uniref:Uncharacterized protein n=1 Tax=Oryza punctata TaxID=4537 RepID=A0A0E0MKG8_ORYPU
MVLGLDCFGVLERKTSKPSPKQQEAEDAKMQKGVVEEGSSKAEKEKSKKAKDREAPLVVPHFPCRSSLGLL